MTNVFQFCFPGKRNIQWKRFELEWNHLNYMHCTWVVCSFILLPWAMSNSLLKRNSAVEFLQIHMYLHILESVLHLNSSLGIQTIVRSTFATDAPLTFFSNFLTSNFLTHFYSFKASYEASQMFCFTIQWNQNIWEAASYGL